MKNMVHIISFGLLFTNPVDAQNYVWPTNASNYMAGSFGEFRPGHFHSGIDIKTWLKEGYDVYAVESGYIWKVRVSPYGYGRVIYHRLDDGRIAIYAHLQRFANRIQIPVTLLQENNKKYSVTKYFKKNQVRVNKGDVIAYTGSTGIGEPHLHFEIRSADNKPLNPLKFGFKIKDSIPPIAKRVSIKPLNAQSEVNGDSRQKIYQLHFQNRGFYTLDDTVRINGDIGIAVDYYDMSNDVSNKYAIYGMELIVNDSTMFSSRYDWFSFSNYHHIEIDRDYRLWRTGVGKFQKVYRESNNSLPFYTDAGDGIITTANTTEKYQDFEIKLFDIYHNTTSIIGTLLIEKNWHLEFSIDACEIADGCVVLSSLNNNRKIETVSFYIDQDNRWVNMDTTVINDSSYIRENEFRYLFSAIPKSPVKIVALDSKQVPSYPVYINFTKNNIRPVIHTVFKQKNTTESQKMKINPVFLDNYVHFEIESQLNVFPYISVDRRPLILRQIGPGRFTTTYALDENSNSFDLMIVSPHLQKSYQKIPINFSTVTRSGGGQAISKDEHFKIDFYENSTYSTLFSWIDSYQPIDSSMNYIGNVYSAEPFDVPLNKEVDIKLKIPENTPNSEQVGMFYWDIQDEEWSFLKNQINENGFISGSTSDLDKFTLIKDDQPPIIEQILPDLTISQRSPKIEVYLKDTVSGIKNEDSILLYLDDEKLIAEYDPEDDYLFYQVKFPLSTGKHVIFVTAQDQLGNTVEKRHYFYISQ